MYKKLLLSLCLIVSAATSYSQNRENTSVWHTQNHENPNKIPVTKYLYNKSGEVFYLFTNDKDNLYVHLRANNTKAQKQILTQGVTISFRTKVKDKKKPKIQYPLSMHERMSLSGKPMGKPGKDRKDFSSDKINLLTQIHDIKLIGFSEDEELIPTVNEDYISGEILFNEHGDLLYTLIIPFNALGLDNTVKTLDIALSSSKSELPDKTMSDSSMRRPSGGMGGGQGRMQRGQGMGGGRGGMRGGGSGKQGPSSQNSSNTINIKIKKLQISHQ